MEDKKDYMKNKIIDRLSLTLQAIGAEIKSDSKLSTREQLTQVDVLLDTLKFLQDYDENAKVLNKYWVQKRWREKFKPYRDDDVDENTL